MSDKSYPKYQADWSIGTQMFHVRCDDWDEFENAVEQMEKIIPAMKDFPDDEGSVAKTAPKTEHVCPIHGATVKWLSGTSKTTGKAYAFWACTAKNADGSYCREKII